VCLCLCDCSLHFRERELFSGREAERRRAQVRAMKLSINKSTVRKQIARAGLLPPAVGDRPLTSSAIATQGSNAQPFRTVQETLHFLHESHRNIRANEGLTQRMRRIESLVAADEHRHSQPSTDGLFSSATSKSLFLPSTAGGGGEGKRGTVPVGEEEEEEEEEEEASEEEEEEWAGDGGLRSEMIRDENALTRALYVHYKVKTVTCAYSCIPHLGGLSFHEFRLFDGVRVLEEERDMMCDCHARLQETVEGLSSKFHSHFPNFAYA
jgi:hypothetical protein